MAFKQCGRLWLASLGLKVLMNTAQKFKYLKQVGHLTKCWLTYKVPWSVILQGTLVGYLKLVMWKNLELILIFKRPFFVSVKWSVL